MTCRYHSSEINMNLSIIIPVLNEEGKIGNDLEQLAGFIRDRSIKCEIIVSDDGSNDGTCAIVGDYQKQFPQLIRLLAGSAHHGKGHAVRKGMMASEGKIVMFMDCGGNVPLHFIATGIDLLEEGPYDIAHGSRYLPESYIKNPMNLKRRTLSKLFRYFTRHYLRLPENLTDTQCGFKLYRGDIARRLYRDVTLEGFLFDPEVVLLSQKYKYRIGEFPIEWYWDSDSRLHPGEIIWSVLTDLRYLRRKYLKQ